MSASTSNLGLGPNPRPPRIPSASIQPDLIDLVTALRAAGFAVGTSEMIDAGRLIRRLGESAQDLDLDALRTKLQPIFCKSRENQRRFGAVFSEWAATLRAWATSPEARVGPAPRDTPGPPESVIKPARTRVPWAAVTFLVVAVAVALYLFYPTQGTTPPSVKQPPTPTSSSVEPVQPAKGVDASARGSSSSAVRTDSIYGYFPSVRYNRELKPVWAMGSFVLPCMLLIALSLPAYVISRARARRSGAMIELDDGPLKHEAMRVVPPMSADIAVRLERHVRARPSPQKALARRAPIDLHRTVSATLRSLGVPTLRYRHVHLRPSYLLLVDVRDNEDPRGRLFYRWAERMRREGLDVDIRLYRGGDGEHAPRSSRSHAWTASALEASERDPLPLDRLENPPSGQRLVIVSTGDSLVDEHGRWKTWTRRARFHRWRERVLFTPMELRDWGIREEAIERAETPADPGFLVLPLDESALEAWSHLLVSGTLPEFVLSESQRFPRLLLDDRLDVLGDEPVEKLDALVAQLRLYLGENGFVWLAACAVPPIIRWELVLLLGERLLKLRGVLREDEMRYLIARNYRRLVQLPWLRARRMPDWLRLRLLAELPADVQETIRATVRGLLDPLQPRSGTGLSLGFEAPPGTARGAKGPAAEGGDILYLGYMSGISPRQLVLRAPASWSRWRSRIRPPRAPGVSAWRHRFGLGLDWLQALWAKLAFRDGLPFSGGASRTMAVLAAGLGLWVAGLLAIAVSKHDEAAVGIGRILFEEREHGLGFRHADSVYIASFSPDGQRVVTASTDHTARLWDAHTGAPLGQPMRHDGAVWHASFSSDGQRVVTASLDGTARLWDVRTGAPLGQPMRHDGGVNHATFSPDGQRVVTASLDGTARLWDAQTGAPLGQPMRHNDWVHHASFSPDGQRVITASDDYTARLWDAHTGAPLGQPMRHDGAVWHASFSPDDQRVATASADHTARVWDAHSGAPLGQPMPHVAWVHHASFSPDGQRVITASDDYTARLWDARTGAPLGQPMRHDDRVWHASFSPDGQHVVTASTDHTARVWDARTGAPLGQLLRHDGRVYHASFSPDGQRVVTASDDHTARLWDAPSGAPFGQPMRHDGRMYHASFSPDGQRVVTASDDRTARLWDARTGAPLGQPMRHDDLVHYASFSPAGQRVVTASADGTARLWDARTGVPLGQPMRHDGWVYHASFSPDGQDVVTASTDHTARLWDARTGAPLGQPMRHDDWVNHASFSPDGQRVVTASDDRTARLWDAHTGAPLGQLMRHDDWVNYASFSPDGQRVVTASDDRTARLWDAHTGAPLGQAIRHDLGVNHASFSPDGQRVVTASTDRTARLWDARTGAPLGQPMRHDLEVNHASFSPDGQRVVTTSLDRTARLWDGRTGAPLDQPMRHDGEVNHASFSPDGRRVVTALTSSAQDKATGEARLWRLAPFDPLPISGQWFEGLEALVLRRDVGLAAGTLVLVLGGAIALLGELRSRRRTRSFTMHR